jgi:hypothetical protein
MAEHAPVRVRPFFTGHVAARASNGSKCTDPGVDCRTHGAANPIEHALHVRLGEERPGGISERRLAAELSAFDDHRAIDAVFALGGQAAESLVDALTASLP